jgi:hypothetical protein
MAKGVLSFQFKCLNFDGEKYNQREWVLSLTKIFDKIPPPFENLDEGWYIDTDKKIAYFYTREFEDKNELQNYLHSIKPIDYTIPCLVRYEYYITDYDTEEECSKFLNHPEVNKQKKSVLSKCLCEEGTTENCKDEVNKFLINKLNTCIKANGVHSLIKIFKGPTSF